MTLLSLAALVLLLQTPPAQSLQAPGPDGPDSTLTAEARKAPLAAREALSDALRSDDLDAAHRLARAYAAAWEDSFFVREVGRFSAWPLERRAAWREADSLRREGIAAYGREGGEPAIVIWRRALAQARALPDTALMAGITGNIGAGFLREGELDSAEASLTRAGALARAVGDRRVEANAFAALGAVDEDRGDPAAARAHYQRALMLHERIGDTRGLAAGRNNLGLLAWAAGDLAEARAQFEAALSLNRRDGRDDAAATNLINLAGLASLRGDFATAERLYRDALATWRARDERAETADALHGLGQLELRRGDYPAAGAVLADALAIYRQTGPLASELQVRALLAGALASQGDLQGASDALRRAEDRAREQGAGPVVQAGITLGRADLAFRLNALAEAERFYSLAERLYRQGSNPDGEAEARHGRALLRLVRQDYAGAETMLTAALRVQLAGGSRRAAGITRIGLGLVARARDDTALARRYLSRAAADLEAAGDPVGQAAALGELGELEAERGLPAAAEALYRRGLAHLEGHPAPDVAWRLYAGLARVRLARGDQDEAARAYRLAIAAIEQAGRTLVLPERRGGFLADKWDVYAQLALLENGRGRPGVAFQVSEQLRAREMLDLLGLGRIGPPAGASAELVAREQDLRRHIAGLTGELEGLTGGTLRGPAPVAEGGAVREGMLAAQGAYADLLLEMRERAPRHVALVAHQPAGWREVARRLRPGEVLIEYLVNDSGAMAFVVAPDTLSVVDLGIGRSELTSLVAFARGTVESPRPATDSLWRGPFRRLYRYLIEPVEATGLLDGATRLVLVPHADLHYLPFAALLGDRGPLVTRFDLATTPSATVWLALGDRAAAPRGQGVLAMAPRTDALPASRREVEAVARLAGDSVQVLTGGRATESAFLQAARGKRILHLATYGVLNKQNPLFSFVEFAPDGEQDGRLEVHEVFGLELSADLVVLSACQTGLGSGRLADVPPGDDWVGLTRAFLHAGARSVVATLWAVDDRATAGLMMEFYREYGAGMVPDGALAASQRAALRSGAHPFYWSGLVVVEGSGR